MPLSFCAQEVYTHDRDLFLRALFAPEDAREALLALYALMVEMERIPHLVSEEMIGHIRYAWWQEAIEGAKTQGHPLLEAPLPPGLALSLVERYREAYPQPITDRDALIHAISLPLFGEKSGKWRKADRIITAHRKKHGRARPMWLTVKLLFV